MLNTQLALTHAPRNPGWVASTHGSRPPAPAHRYQAGHLPSRSSWASPALPSKVSGCSDTCGVRLRRVCRAAEANDLGVLSNNPADVNAAGTALHRWQSWMKPAGVTPGLMVLHALGGKLSVVRPLRINTRKQTPSYGKDAQKGGKKCKGVKLHSSWTRKQMN